jgi:NADH/F420H2 dehydrogenase subunit C
MNTLNSIMSTSVNIGTDVTAFKTANKGTLYFWNFICRVLYAYIKEVKLMPYQNSLVVHLRNSDDIAKVLLFFKKHTNSQFVVLSDLFGIDFMKKQNKRFQIVYCLLSVRFNTRIRVTILADDFSKVPSVTNIYYSAGWLERETWDMFGIFFENNKDLRRILTDYGFDGFPLRKDFPLSGYIELRYDDSLKRVVYEPIEITQEFRFFDFKSPWEQVENIY